MSFAKLSLSALALILIAQPSWGSEKIRLQLGGFAKWFVVGAWQDNDTLGMDTNSVDIKGDVEVHFMGETTLDNGINIGIQIDLEGGGDTSTNTNTIEQSYVYASGGFGKFIIGTTSNVPTLLHVNAPDAAGNIGFGGQLTGGYGLKKPAELTSTWGTALEFDWEVEKISYLTPSMNGLTVGASYTPNMRKDFRGPVDLNSSEGISEVYSAGGLYDLAMGDTKLKVSAGWTGFDLKSLIGSGQDTKVYQYSLGAALTVSPVTVGGSYQFHQPQSDVREFMKTNDNQPYHGRVWDAGIQYSFGTSAVSFYYYATRFKGVNGTDSMDAYQISGAYLLAPGVSALGSLGWARMEDMSLGDTNKGSVLMTGLNLAF